MASLVASNGKDAASKKRKAESSEDAKLSARKKVKKDQLKIGSKVMFLMTLNKAMEFEGEWLIVEEPTLLFKSKVKLGGIPVVLSVSVTSVTEKRVMAGFVNEDENELVVPLIYNKGIPVEEFIKMWITSGTNGIVKEFITLCKPVPEDAEEDADAGANDDDKKELAKVGVEKVDGMEESSEADPSDAEASDLIDDDPNAVVEKNSESEDQEDSRSTDSESGGGSDDDDSDAEPEEKPKKKPAKGKEKEKEKEKEKVKVTKPAAKKEKVPEKKAEEKVEKKKKEAKKEEKKEEKKPTPSTPKKAASPAAKVEKKAAPKEKAKEEKKPLPKKAKEVVADEMETESDDDDYEMKKEVKDIEIKDDADEDESSSSEEEKEAAKPTKAKAKAKPAPKKPAKEEAKKESSEEEEDDDAEEEDEEEEEEEADGDE